MKTTVKPLDTLARRDRRGASSAGGPGSAGDLDRQAPGDRDRREKQQQPAPVLAGIAAAEEGVPGATAEGFRSPPPAAKRLRATFQNCVCGKCSCQKTCQRAMVWRSAPKSWESSRTRRGEGPCRMAATRTTTAAKVNLPAEEPHRRRRHPLAATVPIATETEPAAVLLGQIIAAPGLAGVLGGVQPAAAGTCLLAGAVGKVLVDRKKKRPETGVARQIVVQGRVLRVAGNIQEYTPREPRSSDQALRGDFYWEPHQSCSGIAESPALITPSAYLCRFSWATL